MAGLPFKIILTIDKAGFSVRFSPERKNIETKIDQVVEQAEKQLEKTAWKVKRSLYRLHSGHSHHHQAA